MNSNPEDISIRIPHGMGGSQYRGQVLHNPNFKETESTIVGTIPSEWYSSDLWHPVFVPGDFGEVKYKNSFMN